MIWQFALVGAQSLGGIVQKITSGYDPLTRPNAFGSAVQVQAQYRLNRLFEVDPKTNVFAMDIFLRLQWIDERLKFNDSLGSETLQLRDPTVIWTPDIYFYNGQEKMETLDFSLRVTGSTGQVFWSRHFLMRLSTKFDLRKFPFDTQRLKIQLASYANYQNTMRVEFFKDENGKYMPTYPDPSKTFSSVLWDLKGMTMSLSNITYVVGKPVTDLLEYELIVDRNPEMYVLKFIFPLFFISFASTLTYWIDQSVVPVLFSQELPKVNYATKLDIYIGVTFVVVFASIGEFAYVHYWRQKNETERAYAIEKIFRFIMPINLVLWTAYVFTPGNSGALDNIRLGMIAASVVITLGALLLFSGNKKQNPEKIA